MTAGAEAWRAISKKVCGHAEMQDDVVMRDETWVRVRRGGRYVGLERVWFEKTVEVSNWTCGLWRLINSARGLLRREVFAVNPRA